VAEIGKDILKAKQLLEKGELVAIPTETVYGLAGNALNVEAVAKIFAVKDRPSFDPLIVHVPDLNAVSTYVEDFSDKAIQLANRFWPGPLTLLLKKKEIVPDLVTAGLDQVGIRCPDHLLTQSLLQSLDFPLAAPSANPFGYVSPTRPEHVNEQLGDKIAYILDGGICKIGIESTIVGFEEEKVIVFRLGGLSIEEIEKIIGSVDSMLHSSSNPKAPGQLKNHYAPHKKVVLGDIEKHKAHAQHKEIAVLSFKKDYKVTHQFILSPSGDLAEAAKNLFLALRILDKLSVDTILAELVPNEGLGRAINDRLKRSAATFE
jgi:L-threonylcarbamoyladenylate synthase